MKTIAKRDAARKKIMGNIHGLLSKIRKIPSEGEGKVDSGIGADGLNDLQKVKKKRARVGKNKDAKIGESVRKSLRKRPLSRTREEDKANDVDEEVVIEDVETISKKRRKYEMKNSTRRKSTRKVKVNKGGKGKVEKKDEEETVKTLIYVDSTDCDGFNYERKGNALEFWTTSKLKEREEMELRNGGFGQGDIKQMVIDLTNYEDDRHEVKIVKEKQAKIDADLFDYFDHSNLKGQLCLLESVMGFIKKDKEYLERALRRAIAQFPKKKKVQLFVAEYKKNIYKLCGFGEVVEHTCGMTSLQMGEFVSNIRSGVDSYSMREPLGVCAGICPSNFPALVPLLMFPIAVACGNTFILKPSEKDPGACMILAELAMEAGLPNGVLNIVHGTNDIVNAICDDDDIKAITFVGPDSVSCQKIIPNYSCTTNPQSAKAAEKLSPMLSPSKAAGMFSGTQEKCVTCGKTAYSLEKSSRSKSRLLLIIDYTQTKLRLFTVVVSNVGNMLMVFESDSETSSFEHVMSMILMINEKVEIMMALEEEFRVTKALISIVQVIKIGCRCGPEIRRQEMCRRREGSYTKELAVAAAVELRNFFTDRYGFDISIDDM
ncbi:hypothetical protein SSX86_008379 [Deinandra increscens subsp. villosa]|uniref:Aldehyde dehydrogenase domain-containing protein n=1 Tax=Deinandra increscens subsp. villosa TaxID=3103831 RepID=A0AAP0DJ04_9ASTR